MLSLSLATRGKAVSEMSLIKADWLRISQLITTTS